MLKFQDQVQDRATNKTGTVTHVQKDGRVFVLFDGDRRAKLVKRYTIRIWKPKKELEAALSDQPGRDG